MRAFVTGSTGLLGNNLVRLLLEQGYQVKALVRSSEKAVKIFGNLNITLVKGDMTNVHGFAEQLTDCDILFHCAAYFREYYQPGNHWQKLENININGTIRLLEAAEKKGIKKVIYVSSGGVIGKKAHGELSDETTPPDEYRYSNLYFKSKVLAEEAIDKFLEKHQLSVVLILPGWMFGPGDFAPTTSGQLVLDFMAQKLPVILDGGATIVDPRDVAQAMINAVEKGQTGERYIVGGTPMTMENVFSLLAKITDIPMPKIHIPHQFLMLVAFLAETYGKITGKPVLLSRQGIQTLHYWTKVSSNKAIQELDVTFRPFEQTLQDEVTWFRNHKY